MTYLDINNKTIQYNNDSEDLIELIDYTDEEIQALKLEDIQDLIKERVSELTDYRFFYQ